MKLPDFKVESNGGKMSEFYVYAHIKVKDGRIFYIGKGKGSRLTHKYGRNKWWKNITAKHEWKAQKIKSGLSETCAYCLERILIWANSDKICNLSEGGGVGSSYEKTPEHIAKVAAAQTGKPKPQSTRLAIAAKAKERLSNPENHSRISLIKSRWVHKNGQEILATHLEMSRKFGGILRTYKRVQSGKINSYKGWRIS